MNEIEAAQKKLEQARKEKNPIWNNIHGRSISHEQNDLSDIEDIINNIAQMSENRPKQKCRRCEVDIQGYGSVLCDECIEIFRLQKEKDEEERSQKEYEDRLNHLDKHLAGIGVGARYHSCSFDNFKDGSAYINACRYFVENPQYSIFLTGNYGCGKTHLAVGICKELLKLRKHPSMIFITGAELLLNIRKTFNGGDKSEADVISYYSGPDLLIIDDLGAEKATDWARTTLYVIIDRRDREMLPTIVTSNLSLQQISTNFCGRIASRLSNSKVIKINMPDYRRKRE